MDSFDAIWLFLDRRVSGASAVGEESQFLGLFSEKTSMSVLLEADYDQPPSSSVEAFMDRDMGRVVDQDASLARMASLFREKRYRRLPVVRDVWLVGQVSRRDVPRRAVQLKLGFASTPVGEHADVDAMTIPEEMDLLSIVSAFRNSHYRRVPVMKTGELRGLVSRRDVLKATRAAVTNPPEREDTVSYPSALGQGAQTATAHAR